jgi:hypothetical protein
VWWAISVACKGVLEKNIYRLLVGESKRRSLGRAGDRWKDGAKINNGGVNVSMWTAFIWLGKGREKPRGC